MRDILIKNLKIGDFHKPFIIAEMSGNHNQSLERALEIVDLAAHCGAHAIKLQTYTPDTMTLKDSFTIVDQKSIWKGRKLYELYEEAYTPWEWHFPIFERARKNGLIPFSTPFDSTAVDFLESLDVELYKIASFENTDLPLLRKVAKTGKPIILSTGASTIAEVDEAVRVLRHSGCNDLVLLKCTSSYPATPENSNILTLPHMKELFSCQVGLSDHTMGIGVAIGSVALGARVIEKHFTLNRNDGGVDSEFSIEPQELKSLVTESERAFLSLGAVTYGILDDEKENRVFKRSIFVIKDIKVGEQYSKENIGILRPGIGLAPRFYDNLLGKKASNDLKSGTPLSWEIL